MVAIPAAALITPFIATLKAALVTPATVMPIGTAMRRAIKTRAVEAVWRAVVAFPPAPVAPAATVPVVAVAVAITDRQREARHPYTQIICFGR
jgi:hypothetical protein